MECVCVCVCEIVPISVEWEFMYFKVFWINLQQGVLRAFLGQCVFSSKRLGDLFSMCITDFTIYFLSLFRKVIIQHTTTITTTRIAAISPINIMSRIAIQAYRYSTTLQYQVRNFTFNLYMTHLRCSRSTSMGISHI